MASLSRAMRRVLDDLRRGFVLEYRGEHESMMYHPRPGIGNRHYAIKAQTAKALLNRGLLQEVSRNNVTVTYAAKLEGAVLAEGGVGTMVLNKNRTIGGVNVEAGTRVEASQYHGGVGEEGRFFKRHVRVKVGRKTIEGVVDLANLTKPEDAEQDREALVQRARTALAGLKVAVHPLALQEGEAGCGMLRVACERGDEATFGQAKKRLKRAGLVAYPVKEHPGVLHVRA
jgi:hypothetical protein